MVLYSLKMFPADSHLQERRGGTNVIDGLPSLKASSFMSKYLSKTIPASPTVGPLEQSVPL